MKRFIYISILLSAFALACKSDKNEASGDPGVETEVSNADNHSPVNVNPEDNRDILTDNESTSGLEEVLGVSADDIENNEALKQILSGGSDRKVMVYQMLGKHSVQKNTLTESELDSLKQVLKKHPELKKSGGLAIHEETIDVNFPKLTAHLNELNEDELNQITFTLSKTIKSGNILPEWKEPTNIAYNTALADVEYRYGDVDNFGFGWPKGFDPFSGEETPKHRYPFYPDDSDPTGTDKIMVVSGYKNSGSGDGYTRTTTRPDNRPEKLTLQYDLKNTTVNHALLQIFVDDFQPKVFNTQFKVWLNGEEAPWFGGFVNELEQTGPIGKLLSIQILPEFIPEIEKGQLEILIDDPETDTGDGFAIDFVQLLINPKNIPTAQIDGLVVDAQTKEPIEKALIKISGADEIQTETDGTFHATKVPAGMVVVKASKGGYKNNDAVETLTQGKTGEVKIELEPETDNSLQEQLEEEGRVELYGIYFDTDKAVLRQESEKTLQKVLTLIEHNPKLKLEIGGHTDSQGDEAYNLNLSEKRALAVLNWLKENKANTSLLSSKGYGETKPVANNNIETGRALNRRVELLVLPN